MIASADQPPRDIPFRSPATGHIEDKAIVQGSAVQPMTKLLRVADHTKIEIGKGFIQTVIRKPTEEKKSS